MICKSKCDQQLRLRADINILIEQPSSSWAFRLPIMETVRKTWSMHTWHELFAFVCTYLHIMLWYVVGDIWWHMVTWCDMLLFLSFSWFAWNMFGAARRKITTWMGCYGHDLCKCSHLMVSSSFRRVLHRFASLRFGVFGCVLLISLAVFAWSNITRFWQIFPVHPGPSLSNVRLDMSRPILPYNPLFLSGMEMPLLEPWPKKCVRRSRTALGIAWECLGYLGILWNLSKLARAGEPRLYTCSRTPIPT